MIATLGPIASSGWTMAGVWIAALTLIGIFVRQIVPWKKQEQDSEAQFRDALIRRVENLEADRPFRDGGAA